MVNIAVRNDTLKALLRIATELQQDKEALDRFLTPIPDLEFYDLLLELKKGRQED